MKKSIIFFLVLIFSGFFVVSQETYEINEIGAFEWLVGEIEDDGWGNNIEQISFAVMALSNGGYDYDGGVDRLRDMESNHNWGTVYESAIATMALSHVGEDVGNEVEWLLSQEGTNLGEGKWLIQFDDGGSECNIIYGGNYHKFTIEGLNVTPDESLPGNCLDEDWVNFEDCIKKGTADKYELFKVSCITGLDSSLLYRVGSDQYHIIDESDPDLEIKNGCFGTGSSNCNYRASQYAMWAIQNAGNETYSLPYLKGKSDKNSIDLAFLSILTSEGVYQTLLKDKQTDDGNFENDVKSTAFGAYALKSVSPSDYNSARNWLGFSQEIDGSWEHSELVTSIVLFAVTEGGVGPIPDPTEDINVTETCEGVFGSECPCETGYECNYASCTCEVIVECTFDSDCEIGQLCSLGTCRDEPEEPEEDECEIDSDCFSGEICSFGECVPEPEEDGGVLKWVIAILLVSIVLGIGYYVFIKFFRKGKGGATIQQPKRPSTPAYSLTPQRVPISRTSTEKSSRSETKVEKELDKALKKAKDLIKK